MLLFCALVASATVSAFFAAMLWSFSANDDAAYVAAMLLTLTCAFCVRALYRHLMRDLPQSKLRETEMVAAAIIAQHIQTLTRKKMQTFYLDDYGTPVTAAWDKEKRYFSETVLSPGLRERRVGSMRFSASDAIERALSEMIQPSKRPFAQSDPLAYERACAEALRLSGWNARTTKGSGDQGADVIAEKDGVRIVLQCKLYGKAVGNSAVQEVAAARTHEDCDHAAVVTNAGYTPAARQLAATNRVALLHHDQLREWAARLLVGMVIDQPQ